MRFARERLPALSVLATGVLCPCHALVGLASLVTGGALLSPAAQDGIHAVYVPVAVLVGALLLRKRGSSNREVLRLGVMDDDSDGRMLGRKRV